MCHKSQEKIVLNKLLSSFGGVRKSILDIQSKKSF